MSDPARYAWTVDYMAPQLAVSFAANDAAYGSARFTRSAAELVDGDGTLH